MVLLKNNESYDTEERNLNSDIVTTNQAITKLKAYNIDLNDQIGRMQQDDEGVR